MFKASGDYDTDLRRRLYGLDQSHNEQERTMTLTQAFWRGFWAGVAMMLMIILILLGQPTWFFTS